MLDDNPPFDALTFQDDLAFPDAGLDAVFYPKAALLEVLADADASFEAQGCAAADLLVRHFFLKGTDAVIRHALADYLSPSVLARFEQGVGNFEDNADDVRAEHVLGTLRGVPGERLLWDRLRPVLNAAGFIPLKLAEVDGRPACLLPFVFEQCMPGCDAGTVLDWRGGRHEGWTALFKERLPGLFIRHGMPYCIRLAFVREGRVESMSIDGESLLLPVRMAWARFCGKLPCYDVFRLFATGEIAPNGELHRVETEAKWTLIHTIPGARLIAPDTGNLAVQDPSGVIPEGEMIRDNLPAAIVEKIEEWFVTDWRYAVDRLADQGLVSEINHGRYGNWGGMIRRLEHLQASLCCDDAKERLKTEMWLGQACCHAALTDKAIEHNRNAHRLAFGFSEYRYELQRLDVEMIVNFTDREAFDEVLALSSSLEKELGKDDWKDKAQQADLSMRWHGSLGQALAYGTLDGRAGFSRESAKSALEAALSDARRRKAFYGKKYPDGEVSGLDADIVQDANYVHLWHALFDSSSKAARDSYCEAKKLRCRLESRSAARRKNEVYQLRQLALAAYRSLLAGEAGETVAAETFGLESELSFLDLVDDSVAEPWLCATVAKYLGALKAVSGDADGAKCLFAKASQAIKDGGGDLVARKIAMTVRAEAYRSLRKLFPDIAAQYLSEARQMIDGVPDRGGRWRTWLENPDNAPFPGLSYWY